MRKLTEDFIERMVDRNMTTEFSKGRDYEDMKKVMFNTLPRVYKMESSPGVTTIKAKHAPERQMGWYEENKLTSSGQEALNKYIQFTGKKRPEKSNLVKNVTNFIE